MLRRKYFQIFVSILILTLTIDSCKCDDDEDEIPEDERPKSCQKYLFDFVYGILKSSLKCLGGQGSFKPNNIFEYVTRSSCLLKCILQQEGAIGDDGRLDDIGAAFYFEETFAAEVREIALPIAQGCFSLANDFEPREYWCKSYLAFIECTFGAILKGLIPYGGDCITTPVLGIFFSVLKYLAPDSPKVEEEMEELRRAVANTSHVKCMDKDCEKMYEYKKINGSQSIILYNKDMEVISVENRKTKPKPKDDPNSNKYSSSNDNNYYNNNNNLNDYTYSIKRISKN